jgi:ATP-binding cassette subfamily C protein
MVATAPKPAKAPAPFRGRIKTPTLLQMEAVECGAAALGIILAAFRRIVPLEELRRECGVSRDGSKASNVLKAARNYGLVAKGFKKDLEGLRQLRPPYIVFWNFNHFLVVEGFVGDRVFLNDPATGPRSVTMAEFDEAFTGVVLVFEKGPDFKPGGSKRSTWGAIYRRLQTSWGGLGFAILAGFFLVIPGLAIPVFTQVFVDQVLVESRQEWLRPLLLGMGLTAILRGFLKGIQLRCLRQLKIKLAVATSGRLLWHILRLPVDFYAQRFSGEIASRISLNDKVADVLSGQLTTTVIDAVLIGFYGIVMLQYDGVMTLLIVLLSAFNFVALQSIARKRVDATLRLGVESGKETGVAISGLMGIETLKASALESDFFTRWSGYNAKGLNATQELGEQNQLLAVLPLLLSGLTTALVLTLGGLRVMDGAITIGMLVAFQGLLGSFIGPINTLLNLGSSLQDLESDLTRLDDVLGNPISLEAEQQISEATALLDDYRLKGEVEVRDLTFGYNPVEPPLVQNFSMHVQPGQRVALVGGSGSGKSTVAKILAGLYKPWSGQILFDGQLREQVPRRSMTDSLAMVEQEIFLFAGTIRQNLTLWDSTVPDKNLVRACRDALIEEVVLALPGGYDAQMIEGGVNLSGGQRQRMELARALINDPSVLVMDEATSALDGETEEQVMQHIRRRGCTCIIVAHRLSTIRDCDEIIVLEKGKIVQRGSHEELLEMGGAYARLISVETEGGEGEE